MQKNKFNQLIIIALTISLCLAMSGASFANGELNANKSAQKTGCTNATVTIVVNGSSQTTVNPADIVLAIDSSGSMSTSDPTGLRKTSANNFINKLNATKDKVGVVNWDDNINQQLALTNNFTQAKNVVNQSTPGGTTNGALAISTSIAILDADATLQPYQKFIILLTDGLFNEPGSGSNPNTQALAQADAAAAKGYKIFTIGLGSNVDPAILGLIASKTGGQYYFASNATVLDSIYNQIFQSITSVASNITVTDVVPNYMTFQSATKNPTTNVLNGDGTRTLTWLIPNLGQGQSWNVSYNLVIDPDKKYGNNVPTNVEAFIDYKDPTGAPGHQTLPIPLLNFQYSSLGDFVWNDVNGNGIQDAGEPGIKDVLVELFKNGVSKGTTLTNAAGFYEFTGLTPGNYNLKFTLPTGYFFTLQNQGANDAVDSDANPANGLTTIFNLPCDTRNLTWDAGMRVYTDLAVNKVVDKAAQYVGQNVVYTITVTNNGPSNASGVSVTDLMPGALQFVSASSGAYNSGTDTWTIGNLANGASVALQIVAKVLTTGNFLNTAVVDGAQEDLNPGNNQDGAQTSGIANADLAVDKVVDKAAQYVGQNLVYTINVINNGPSNATGVTVTDLLPSGLQFISASSADYNSTSGVWTIGNLSVGQIASLTINALVTVSNTTITNTAVVQGNEEDLVPENNTSSATTEIYPASDLNIVKTVEKSKVTVGDTVKFIITVTNNGPDTAANVIVTDIVPDGLSFLSSNASVGSYDPSSGMWVIGDLTNAQVATLTIFAEAVEAGIFENTAAVTSDTYDPVSEDNSSTVTVEIEEPQAAGGPPEEPAGPSGPEPVVSEVQAETVPMQTTGAPILPIVAGVLLILVGISRRK